jgi:hypothetical protein
MSFLNVNQIQTAGNLPSFTTGANTITFNGSTNVIGASSAATMKNRLINGDMRFNQRGASNTSNGYTLDRWVLECIAGSKLTAQQSSSAPVGFINSELITSSTALSVSASDYYNLQQRIEGYNVADLNFGTANAKTVTISFWAQSSLTGTFGGSLMNGAESRSYPFTFTISSANTWTQFSITIPGDTTGTWATDNSSGMILAFGLAHGSTYQASAGSWTSGYKFPTGAVNILATNGATFYITGVQLEIGSAATSFDFRHYGQELQLCQRYYQQTNSFTAVGVSASSNIYGIVTFPVTMRSSPSIGQTAALQITDGVTNDWTQSPTGISINSSRVSIYGVDFTGDNFASVTAYRPYFAKQNVTGLITLSAEL